MSTNALKEVATGVAKQPKAFPEMLTAWLPEIQRALPKHMNADRMARIALTAFRQNPKLADCDPRSVFAAVIQSSQLGLEVGTLGRAYLVPYDKKKKIGGHWKVVATECQFIPGWKGLVDLMNNSGKGTVWTGAVFLGDEFDWQLGDNPFVKHKPAGGEEEGKLLYTYAIGRIKNSEYPICEVWPVQKLIRHRDRYNKVGDSHYSFQNFEMYARKIPLLQVLKYMPCSPELAAALEMDDAAQRGAQNLSIKDALDGSWSAAHDEPEDTDDTGNNTGAPVVDKNTGEIDSTQNIPGAGAQNAAGQVPETARTGQTANASQPVTTPDSAAPGASADLLQAGGPPTVDFKWLLQRFKNPTALDIIDADATLIGQVEGQDPQNILADAYKKGRAELVEKLEAAKKKK